MKQGTSYGQGGSRAWFIWSLSAMAFGYAFFQRVAPSVMVSDLMAEFSIGAGVLGYLSALYFYPYVAMQVPLGALLDRLGARWLLTSALAIASAGSLLFASAGSIEVAFAGRTLVGIGSAVGFLGSLALAAKWFPPKRFALLAGLTMLAGMASGVGGQAPLALAVEWAGWRSTMFAGGAFAAILALAILVFVRDAPGTASERRARPVESWRQVWRSFTIAIGRAEIWLIAVVATAMSGPMLAFGGLWGVPFIMREYGLDRADAAFYVSMLLVGWAVGAPFGGWLSDRIGLRKAPVLAGATLETLLMGAIVTVPGMPLWLMVIVMFGIGFSGSWMVITFALAREVSTPDTQGTVSGIVNAMTVASGAVLQPVIGLLLDWQWSGALSGGARIYSAAEYKSAFTVLVGWSLLAVLCSLAVRETHCRALGHDIRTA